MLNYSDLLLLFFIYLFVHLFISLFICLLRFFFQTVDTSETTKACVNVICICLRHESVLLLSMSCDWETVKNVVPGDSSTKPDQTGGDGKGV